MFGEMIKRLDTLIELMRAMLRMLALVVQLQGGKVPPDILEACEGKRGKR